MGGVTPSLPVWAHGPLAPHSGQLQGLRAAPSESSIGLRARAIVHVHELVVVDVRGHVLLVEVVARLGGRAANCSLREAPTRAASAAAAEAEEPAEDESPEAMIRVAKGPRRPAKGHKAERPSGRAPAACKRDRMSQRTRVC